MDLDVSFRAQLIAVKKELHDLRTSESRWTMRWHGTARPNRAWPMAWGLQQLNARPTKGSVVWCGGVDRSVARCWPSSRAPARVVALVSLPQTSPQRLCRGIWRRLYQVQPQ